MTKIAIYPGTFDPITNGHLDIIERATKLFDKIIVAVAASLGKSPAFSLDQRLELVKTAVASLKNVETYSFNGLLVEFAQQKKAHVILRGMRAVSDFEYELQLLNMNRKMAPQIETIFLAPAEQYAFVSATIVREIIEMGGDASIFVPKGVATALQRMRKKL
jgi:pantetheine-phosphate adenylyltransferase